ncbi:hypothetical protein [Nocardiopsis kunsanensis]|nr:hypothetical protein [Nocardiopsis kunsanensis]
MAHPHGPTAQEDGQEHLLRRLVLGGALNHGADIGRWRGPAPL